MAGLIDEGGEGVGARDGAVHLRMLARAPRAAGSAAEDAARDYCARVLGETGFTTTLEPFEYSGFPGRYGTPVGGAIATATVATTAWLALIDGSPAAAGVALAAGLVVLALFTWLMLGDGVLDLPLVRTHGVNLVARRGAPAPRVWLVAHLDSKSQPVPSRLRVAGVSSLAAGVVLTIVALVLTLATGSARIVPWALALALAGTGGAIVMASVVRNESDGAVDDASGVAAVLAAAAMVDREVRVGVLLTSAEELGLAGARAWARAHRGDEAVLLNCDGVDDQGELTIMYTRTRPDPLVEAVRRASGGTVRVRRMPPGLLLDSVAFSDAGQSAITLSHGSLRTLARVHTRDDSLANLEGDGIPLVAGVLARAAEALTR